jgi:hypothetical protein
MSSWRRRFGTVAGAVGVGAAAASTRDAAALAAVNRLVVDLDSAVDLAIEECATDPTAITRSDRVHDRLWAAFATFDAWHGTRATAAANGAAAHVHVGVKAIAIVVLTSHARLQAGAVGSSPLSLALWLTECALHTVAYVNMLDGEDNDTLEGAHRKQRLVMLGS